MEGKTTESVEGKIAAPVYCPNVYDEGVMALNIARVTEEDFPGAYRQEGLELADYTRLSDWRTGSQD